MNESSGSQYIRNITGIESGPDAKSGVTGILCCFRLVLQRKAGKRHLSHQG